VLISGPPGIGKTTTARIVAKHLGYKVLEWNASDVRSKLSIEENVGHLGRNRTLG
jgi:replication factor C subunit 1